MNYFSKKGISVIEALIVFAAIGLMVAIVLPQFSKVKENQVLKTALGDTLSAVSRARGRTLASQNSSEYGVHFQSDKVIIFKGKVFSAVAPDNEEVSIVSPASITNVTLGGVSGTSGDMYFARLSGSPSASGTVTITTSSYSKVITISATGGASSN